MSSRERFLANAEKCQRCAELAYSSGTKRLYGVLASQWRQLGEEAERTDKLGSPPLFKELLKELRHSRFLRKIDKAEVAIRELSVAAQ
jgi:hypothetical protein